jgi:hypothetical protein
MAPGHGFEPWLPGPKPGVLPLDDPGMLHMHYRCQYTLVESKIRWTNSPIFACWQIGRAHLSAVALPALQSATGTSHLVSYH